MNHETNVDAVEPPVSVSHFVHVLRAYAGVIGISLAAVAVGYLIVAGLVYLLAPVQKTTIQPFRLQFRGATEGMLPNGTRFSPPEIISTPVLLRVFEANNLPRFTTFSKFSRSVFILESNREYEKLVNEYQALLHDARLTPLDRDRIQREFEAKSESISKSDLALCYARGSDSDMPETVVRKVLADILTTWAEVAANDQHALEYRVAVLSPQILDDSEARNGDVIMTIAVLRSRISRLIDNIEELRELPAAELIKTKDGLSLDEIRMRLEDIVRFRLEPLIGVARTSGLVSNPAVTVHFLETQLAHDQRRLQAARSTVAAARDALMMYSNDLSPVVVTSTTATSMSPSSAGQRATGRPEGETVMPQLSDTFLDRLVELSKHATDSQFRQTMIDKYQRAVVAAIPLEEAVSYDQQVLDELKSGTSATASRTDAAAVRAEIDDATGQVRQLIGKITEIYKLASRNLHPATQLLTTIGPPSTRVERAGNISRLGLYGIIVLLIALPIIVIFCLLHNRVREEEMASSV